MRTWLLESLQNFPLACAFLFGYAQYSRGALAAAAVVILTGTLAGVLLIRRTEPLITGGPVERRTETLGNFLLFSASMALMIPYFRWETGGWLPDIGIASGIGILTAALQARAAGEAFSPQHAAALLLAFNAAFLLLRSWALQADPLTAAVILTAILSTIITAVEYRGG